MSQEHVLNAPMAEGNNFLARLPMFAIHFGHTQAIEFYHTHMHAPFDCQVHASAQQFSNWRPP